MSERIKVVKRMEIKKKKSLFDIASLYKDLRKQIKDELKYGFTEKEQASKTKPKGRETKVIFEANREIDEFCKFWVKIEFLFENINRVMFEGKQLDGGDVRVVCSSELELDYTNKWNVNAFTLLAYKIYTKYLIKAKIKEIYKKKLREEIHVFHDFIKERLELYK